MNSKEATEAVNAIVFDMTGDTRAERMKAKADYHKAVAEIEIAFRDWLYGEYAYDLPVEVQARVWSKAWENGHAYGYSSVENEFMELAEFAQTVRDNL